MAFNTQSFYEHAQADLMARGGVGPGHTGRVGVRRLRLWTPPAATSVLAHMFPPSCIQPRLSRTSSAPTLSQHDSVFAVPGRTQVCLTCVVRPTRSPIVPVNMMCACLARPRTCPNRPLRTWACRPTGTPCARVHGCAQECGRGHVGEEPPWLRGRHGDTSHRLTVWRRAYA